MFFTLRSSLLLPQNWGNISSSFFLFVDVEACIEVHPFVKQFFYFCFMFPLNCVFQIVLSSWCFSTNYFLFFFFFLDFSFDSLIGLDAINNNKYDHRQQHKTPGARALTKHRASVSAAKPRTRVPDTRSLHAAVHYILNATKSITGLYVCIIQVINKSK